MPRVPASFTLSLNCPAVDTPGLWFLFVGRKLLIGVDNTVPKGNGPSEWGLSALRTQFLGFLEDAPCFSGELAPGSEAPAGMTFRDLRGLFGCLSESLMGVASRAVQVMDWDRTHQFCGACGTRTERHPRQLARVCPDPQCGQMFFPRLAPAMIVAVERGPEILLGRSPHFPPEIYSVLAGFVEPGESVEDAVHREVHEETRIRVCNVRYFGSQPWPFPNSLMLGYQADYESGDVVPEPGEIEDAGFFHVDRLPKLFPGNISISQWLIHDFVRRNQR